MSQFQQPQGTQFTNPVAPAAQQSATNAGQFAQQNQQRALEAAQMRQRGAIASKELSQRQQEMQAQQGQFQQELGFRRQEGEAQRGAQLKQTEMEQQGWDKQRESQAQQGELERQARWRENQADNDARKEQSSNEWRRSLEIEQLRAKAALLPEQERMRAMQVIEQKQTELDGIRHKKTVAEKRQLELASEKGKWQGNEAKGLDETLVHTVKMEELGQEIAKTAGVRTLNAIEQVDPESLGERFWNSDTTKRDVYDQWGVEAPDVFSPEALGLGTAQSAELEAYLRAGPDQFRREVVGTITDNVSRSLVESGFKTGGDAAVKEAIGALLTQYVGQKAAAAAGQPAPHLDADTVRKQLEGAGIPPTVMREVFRGLGAMADDAEHGALMLETEVGRLKGAGGGKLPATMETARLLRKRELMDTLKGVSLWADNHFSTDKVLNSRSIQATLAALKEQISPEGFSALSIPESIAGAIGQEDLGRFKGFLGEEEALTKQLRESPIQEQSLLDEIAQLTRFSDTRADYGKAKSMAEGLAEMLQGATP